MSENKSNTVGDRLSELEIKIDLILDQLANNRDVTTNANKIVDNNFEILNSKIGGLKKKISELHSDTNQNFEEVKMELVKINSATGYVDLTSNLKIVQGGKN